MSIDHYFCATNVLYSGCPACEINRKHTCFWYHHGCGYKTCICYDDLHVFCPGCGLSAIMFEWKFSCKDHGFRKVELQGLLYALTVLATSYGRVDHIQKALRIATREYYNYIS